MNSTKPRLLLVGHTYMIAVNREKANALAEYFDILVATSDSSGWNVMGKEVSDSEADKRSQHYQLHRLRRWPRTQKFTAFMLRGLGASIREFRPDIILVENEPWSMLRWQTRLCAWHCAPDARFAEFTWENVRRRGMKGVLFKLIYRAAARSAGLVICGNRAAGQLFLKAGLPKEKLHIDGQLGVAEADFPLATKEQKQAWRTQLGWNSEDFVIGFCGRLVEEKGVSELALAVDSLRTDFPNLRLAILGNGPVDSSLTEIGGGGDWLRMFPPVPHLEVHAFLNNLDLFVLPSKPLNHEGKFWEEQFGHVLIEAITAGALTLGSDSGAIPEVLDNPQMVFPHSSQQAIAAILRSSLSQPERLDILRHEQRNVCIARWSHTEVARRYAAFLNGGKSDQ